MANSVQDIEAVITAKWNARSHKVDYMHLETLQRDILRLAADGILSPRDALLYIDEAMAAFTRRGNCLPKGFQK